MSIGRRITRRESIKRMAVAGGGLAACGLSGLPLWRAGKAGAATEKFVVEGVGRSEGYPVKELVTKVFDAAGGIGRFVSRGDVVAVKPNISWARSPEMAATTNPEVLRAVVELAYDAGARKVRIADHTINDARRCFAVTGAGSVAEATGAELVFPRTSLMRRMRIHGERLDVWPVFVPMVEADCLINLPIAKTHGLSKLTLAMKNWIGGVGGRRHALHQDIHRTVVDLAQFFNPSVTLVDALRIMVRNGPSGGSPEDAETRDTLILSNDQVAADAWSARLFGVEPSDLGFVVLGEKSGLGTRDPGRLAVSRVEL